MITLAKITRSDMDMHKVTVTDMHMVRKCIPHYRIYIKPHSVAMKVYLEHAVIVQGESVRYLSLVWNGEELIPLTELPNVIEALIARRSWFDFERTII